MRLFSRGFVSALPVSSARSTDTFAPPMARVIGSELMPVDAMRLNGVLRRKPSPANDDVLSQRNWLQVIRINAPSHATQVIKLKSFGDGSDHLLVVPTMSHRETPSSSLGAERSVAFVSKCGSPNPASEIISPNVEHESFDSGKSERRSRCRKRVTRCSPPLIVLGAPSADYGPSSVAPFDGARCHHNENLSLERRL